MRHNFNEKFSEEIQTRLIVWQLVPDQDNYQEDLLPLNQHERIRVLDSIARSAKPIIVLKGKSIIQNKETGEIISYGQTLDLKMIVEILPEELSQQIIDRYNIYGPRVFRLSIDNHIIEDAGTRFQNSARFLALEEAVNLLKSNGFEVHLSLTITNPDKRMIACNLDYAYLKGAKGLYCHIQFPLGFIRSKQCSAMIDEFLLGIAEMKEMIPCRMYFSPQCVKYSTFASGEGDTVKTGGGMGIRWKQTCLAGKTYGFIDPYGMLRFCPGTGYAAGGLRNHGYDFRRLWICSELFYETRLKDRTCSESRLFLEKTDSGKKYNQIPINENVGDLS